MTIRTEVKSRKSTEQVIVDTHRYNQFDFLLIEYRYIYPKGVQTLTEWGVDFLKIVYKHVPPTILKICLYSNVLPCFLRKDNPNETLLRLNYHTDNVRIAF